MNIKLDEEAPDFSLYDTTKTKVTLSELRDRNVLLLFFPLAFTSTCTKELCSVRDNINLYNECNATVLGISVDSPQTLAKYKEEQKLNFSLLSDFNKEVSELYGSLYENFSAMNMKGVSKRSAFIVDKKGVIKYAEVLDNAGDLPDFEKIQRILLELD